MKSKPKRADLRMDRKYPQFRIFYEDGTVKYFSKRCSLETAKKLLGKINDRIALGTFDMKDFTIGSTKSLSLVKFSAEYLWHRQKEVELKRLSPDTAKHDYYSFRLFMSYLGPNMQIHLINDTHIDNFVLSMIEDKSPRGINSHLKHLSSAFTYAKEKGYIQSNPFFGYSKLKTKQKKRIFTDDEIIRIRERCSQLRMRWKLDVFNLALWTGARRIELFRLKKNSLKYINVPGLGENAFLELNGKGNKDRTVALGPNALALIRERIDILESEQKRNKLLNYTNLIEECRQRVNEKYLFFEIARHESISKEFRKILHSIDIIDATFHDTRKSYGSYALEDSVTMETVSESMGHSDIRITQSAYTEVTLKKMVIENRMRKER